MRVSALLAVVMVSLLVGSCTSGSEEPTETERAAAGAVTVDGAELQWVREGKGTPLFVLGSSVYYPKAYSANLRDHFEMVFVDGRHFVPSYAPGQEVLSSINLTTFADDVEAIRRDLGYDDITVVGHSVHGQIALEYADRYPETTERVVLIAAVPYAFGEFADEAARFLDEEASEARKTLLDQGRQGLDALLAEAPETRSFALTYDAEGPLYWAEPSYDATAVLEGLENGPAFSRLFASVSSRDAARARLERIDTPILLVLGGLDFAIPHTAWEELIEGLDGIDYTLMPEDSHNPQTESPSRFDPILIEWME